MKNKIVKKMIEETNLIIKNSEYSLERAKIVERFARRNVLSGGVDKGNEGIAKAQDKVRVFKLSIKANEKFLSFLEEIKDEE